MLMSYLWATRISIFLVILQYPFFKTLFKKSYTSFKIQFKWNISAVGSHFSSLWTPKKLWFSFFFSYLYVLSYIHNFLTLHQFITCTISNIWHNWSICLGCTAKQRRSWDENWLRTSLSKIGSSFIVPTYHTWTLASKWKNICGHLGQITCKLRWILIHFLFTQSNK